MSLYLNACVCLSFRVAHTVIYDIESVKLYTKTNKNRYEWAHEQKEEKTHKMTFSLFVCVCVCCACMSVCVYMYRFAVFHVHVSSTSLSQFYFQKKKTINVYTKELRNTRRFSFWYFQQKNYHNSFFLKIFMKFFLFENRKWNYGTHKSMNLLRFCIYKHYYDVVISVAVLF